MISIHNRVLIFHWFRKLDRYKNKEMIRIPYDPVLNRFHYYWHHFVYYFFNVQWSLEYIPKYYKSDVNYPLDLVFFFLILVYNDCLNHFLFNRYSYYYRYYIFLFYYFSVYLDCFLWNDFHFLCELFFLLLDHRYL